MYVCLVYLLHIISWCASSLQYFDKNILLFLSEQRIRPTQLWPTVSKVSASIRLLYCVSHLMSDNLWQYSLNFDKYVRFQCVSDILTDSFSIEIKETYDGSARISLKVVSATYLLICFVYLYIKESTCETSKNIFYFTSKALFVLEIIKF